jgi:hypothetical protein
MNSQPADCHVKIYCENTLLGEIVRKDGEIIYQTVEGIDRQLAQRLAVAISVRGEAMLWQGKRYHWEILPLIGPWSLEPVSTETPRL